VVVVVMLVMAVADQTATAVPAVLATAEAGTIVQAVVTVYVQAAAVVV
jgi:hypothetical protein